jgi:hypothetical protein
MQVCLSGDCVDKEVEGVEVRLLTDLARSPRNTAVGDDLKLADRGRFRIIISRPRALFSPGGNFTIENALDWLYANMYSWRGCGSLT